MTVIYNMSIDRADKPWIGDRRLTEVYGWPPSRPAQWIADLNLDHLSRLGCDKTIYAK